MKTVVTQFLQQAQRHPNNPAVSDIFGTYTYEQIIAVNYIADPRSAKALKGLEAEEPEIGDPEETMGGHADLYFEKADGKITLQLDYLKKAYRVEKMQEFIRLCAKYLKQITGLYLKDTQYPAMLVLRNIVSGSSMAGQAGGVGANASLAIAVKSAVIIITTIPPVLIYPFLQKHFVKGMTIGAVKG